MKFEHLKPYVVKDSGKDIYEVLLNQAQNSYIGYNHFLSSILEKPLIRQIRFVTNLISKNMEITILQM